MKAIAGLALGAVFRPAQAAAQDNPGGLTELEKAMAERLFSARCSFRVFSENLPSDMETAPVDLMCGTLDRAAAHMADHVHLNAYGKPSVLVCALHSAALDLSGYLNPVTLPALPAPSAEDLMENLTQSIDAGDTVDPDTNTHFPIKFYEEPLAVKARVITQLRPKMQSLAHDLARQLKNAGFDFNGPQKPGKDPGLRCFLGS